MAEKPKYKYNLNHQISLLPRNKTIELISGELEKEGIAERTFFRDRSIKINDPGDIPSERLMIYAKFFDVSIDELFNYDNKVKPIAERKLSSFDKILLKKTGLGK
jgi:hypothetical protein